MLTALFALLFSVSAHAQDCEAAFQARGESLARTQEAISCHEAALSRTSDRREKALHLNHVAYLKFFSAEYFLTDKLPALKAAFETAEQSILLFGRKYDLAGYRSLTEAEKTELAWGLYYYGLAIARYVDIRGVAEALLRMDDIKRSMNTIIRLEQESVAFFGAHRTLGIFHTKVPAIAGGDIETAKRFLPLAVSSTLFNTKLSLFPLNNIAYGDLLFKIGDKTQACEQWRLVASLTPAEVEALGNGHIHETMGYVREARATLAARQCP